MLQEMGLRLWLAPSPAGAGAGSTAPAAESAALPTLSAAPAAAVAVAPGRPAEAVAPQPDRARPPAPAAAVAPAAAAASPLLMPALIDASTLDWPALRAAVAGCRACSLCETRRQTVFGIGHPRAHCMIVGEAPGELEDACGEPFVGESGQLLDRMLRALGLSRDTAEPADPARQVYIANTLKCRPPRNRNPSAGELAACQPFLERQVALVQPRVILAMGRFAVQSLLGSDEPIGRLRGRLHHWRGVPLVVTYHPDYLLRHLADKARAWDDLCLAATCLDGKPD